MIVATVVRVIAVLVAVSSVIAKASNEVPGAVQDHPIAIVGATVHPVSGPAIENGVVLFDAGKIVAVGPQDRVKLPADTEQIRAQGRHVYPGLFEAHSHMGLFEIEAVRATRDQAETGRINPNVRAHVSVNPDSELIPVTRANGVLLAVTSPSGGLISGQAAVLQLDGWTYEDLTLQPGVAMMVHWPGVPDGIKPDEKDPVQELRDLFDDARAYAAARAARPNEQTSDLKLESLAPVLDRSMPLLVAADGLSTIQSAVAFAVEQNVRLIILGGYDAPLCADLLREHNVPIIVSAVYRLPRRRSDAFDDAYTLPERLRQAGLRFCISGTDSSRTSNARNLPYHAATAVAYGLPADEALKAITMSPAEILGVADRVGSLEAGKDATLIMTTGNPLETESQVIRAWVQGRSVRLTSRHTRLYDKYREKQKAEGGLRGKR